MTNLPVDPSARHFSRPINVEKIKSKGLRQTIAANEQEREKLAEQLTLKAIDGLNFNCLLLPWNKGGVELSGQVTATIRQTCVVTLEVFTTEISQDVRRYFERAGQTKSEMPVLDLENIEDDISGVLENGLLNIGDIAVETLVLCLSPYPRKPGAVFADHVESPPGELQGENPFDVLQKLKKH